MKCSNCGSELKEGEKFCQNCGTEITIQSENQNDLVNSSNAENKIEENINVIDNQSKMILPENESNNDNINSQNKSKKPIIIILVIIVLIILGGLVYYFINMNSDSKNKTNNDDKSVSQDDKNKLPNNDKLDNNENDDANKTKLYIYKFRRDLNGTEFEETIKISNEKIDDNKYTLLGNYVCSSIDCHKGANNSDYYNSNYPNVVIYDNGYLLYNYDTNAKTKLNINDNDIDTINLLKTNSNKNNYNGAFVTKGERENARTAIYDLEHNKYVTGFDFLYYNFYYVDNDLLLAFTTDSSTAKVFSLKNLEIVNDSTTIGPLGGQATITKMPLKNSSKAIYSYNNLKGGNKILLDNVLNHWPNGETSIDNALNSDDSITLKKVVDFHNYYIYDVDGKQIYKSKDYTAIIVLLTDYVVVNDNNTIKIIDYKEKNEYVLFEINNNMAFAYNTSNVIKDGYIEFNVVNEPTVEYFKDYPSTVYRFNFADKKISKQEETKSFVEGYKIYKIN